MSQRTQTSLAEANHVAHEAISCIRTVASFANEKYEARRYGDKLEDYYRVSLRQGLMDGIYYMCVRPQRPRCARSRV